MFEYGGKNNFNGRFDYFEWSAPFFETPDEVLDALKAIRFKSQKLAAIRAIGSHQCKDMNKSFNDMNNTAIYMILSAAGIDCNYGWWNDYPQMDKVLLPWSVELSEPLQFVFDKGLTIELMPTEKGGARIGVNSIPLSISDGLNRSTLDANILFQEFIGERMSDVTMRIEYKETQYIERPFKSSSALKSSPPRTEESVNYVIHIFFGGCQELEITYDWAGRYWVSATVNHWIKRVPISRIRAASKEIAQVEIIHGRDNSPCGAFLITAVNSETKQVPPFTQMASFGISINQFEFGDYLTGFFHRNNDVYTEDAFDKEKYDWTGNNLYSFDTIRLLLSDIRRAMELIEKDYNNPELDSIKSHWLSSEEDYYPMCEMSASQLRKKRWEKIPIALSFYERFCSCLEKLMQIPGTDLICISGSYLGCPSLL